MKKLLVSLMLALGLTTIGSGAAPTITPSETGENFLVMFDRGAIHACTVFRMVKQTEPIGDPNFPDGHYTPRHCWMLSGKDDQYVDDWDYIKKYDTAWEVWAEIQYPDRVEHGTTYPSDPIKTNVVTVWR